MLWLVARTVTPGSRAHRKLVRVACECARTALPYIQDEETAAVSLACIQTTEAWTHGQATIEEVREARDAAAAYSAYAADAASDAAYAAAYAADAAAYAAYAADDAAAYAADAAAYAAYAAAYAAYAADDAGSRARRELCDLIRTPRAYPRPQVLR
ncbi:MAG TPA: hypothetical protein VFV05_00980 [Methylomirabilota bacterium]|nr:hypothetical protein [Methylomirabilota bacterium]